MNSVQIDRVLKRFKVPGYSGVYPCNRIPKSTSGRCAMVINLDNDRKPGSHWVCVFVDDSGRGEYFDTFGRPPSGPIKNYLMRNCSRWTYNRRQIQSAASSYCGHYCILYCIFRSRGLDLNKFVCMFSKNDTGLNDMLASKMFASLRK